MSDVRLELETTAEGTDGGDVSTYVSATVMGPDRRNHTASAHFDDDASDDEVAAALLRVALGVAQLHSSGAWMALQRRVHGPRDES
jgi:hypothetical protein